MGRINILDEKTANSIKAGEVIERPVSVVKELVDNSIDAGSSRIKIEFENGGISMIRVSDNGIGMDREDAEKSFLIHATSKITKIEDIYDLSTQGFRGEALASIGACSEVTLLTKQHGTKTGTQIVYRDGSLVSNKECAADDGTESMYICGLVEKLAIINPHIAMKLIKDGKQVFSTPGNGDMKDAVYSLYGKDIANELVPLDYEYEGLKLKGFAGRPSLTRGNRGMQYVYVNDRSIKNTSVTAAIDEAYRNSLMKNKFPVVFLAIYVPPGGVDVNVHPQKAEVKFSNESDVFRLVYHGIKNALFEKENVVPDLVKEAGEKETEVKNYAVTGEKPSVKETPLSKKIDVSYSKPAMDLFEILSEFKPDIEEIGSSDGPAGDVIHSEESAGDEISIPSDAYMEKTSLRDDIEALLKAEFRGIIFATYILMQSKEDLFVVDQHAAHERVLYEKFMKRRMEKSGSSDVEMLLVPSIIELTASDHSFVSDNLSKFKENGFEIDIMGERQIALRSIPVADTPAVRLKSMDKPSVIFERVLADLKRDVPKKDSIWYSLIQTTACKAAIKAHDVITREEAEELIRSLGKLDDPYHCAHGRPTFIRIPLTDIEKRFKRIL